VTKRTQVKKEKVSQQSLTRLPVWRDLGLTYEKAMQGIHSATKFVMTKEGLPNEGNDVVLRMLKRVCALTDVRASDTGTLAHILVEKGVFTDEEFVERLRLSANEQLAMFEAELSETCGAEIKFR
jgi:hypothetical protein